jgi:hypothetical protein
MTWPDFITMLVSSCRKFHEEAENFRREYCTFIIFYTTFMSFLILLTPFSGPSICLSIVWVVCLRCKVHGLTLLLRVGTLWRCSDGLFFEVLPLANDALLKTLHPLLENVLQTVCPMEQAVLTSELPFHVRKSQEIAWSESRLNGECSNGILPISVSASIATF